MAIASAFAAPSRISCMQTGLCRMRTESLAGPSPRTGRPLPTRGATSRLRRAPRQPSQCRLSGVGRVEKNRKRDKQLARTTTLPLGSQQNASPFCDHVRCRVCARRIRNLPAGADNGLVAGANPEFPVSAEHPRFSAVWGGCNPFTGGSARPRHSMHRALRVRGLGGHVLAQTAALSCASARTCRFRRKPPLIPG